MASDTAGESSADPQNDRYGASATTSPRRTSEVGRLLRAEAGYSLVEVMVSMFILAAAIIPMISMFDTGLKGATNSGKYDTARAFANAKLEEAKTLSYARARDDFPTSGASRPVEGHYVSPGSPTDDVPPGFGYTVEKRYLDAETSVVDNAISFAQTNIDKGLMRVTVTVTWDGNTYRAITVVADDEDVAEGGTPSGGTVAQECTTADGGTAGPSNGGGGCGDGGADDESLDSGASNRFCRENPERCTR